MSIYLGPVVLVLENSCKIQLSFITDPGSFILPLAVE